ncbi:glycosyl hydrolase [uncultured Paludibaculum sp.]|uniref:glycosyl hydrolase n=1 Tax=uncultured Paludibaculum sp. TaxID=1765020 RepID=UPI002AABD7D1|nr:glycosyl hydrolase [uncultured Paludibaculum sp.]
MCNRRPGQAAVILVLAASGITLLSAAPIDTIRASFAAPPADSRIMMRWWWFGPAVTHHELQRELEMMKAGGIGGVEIQPVYPLALDNPEQNIRNLTFLSPPFVDSIKFAADKGRELGLRVDMTLGSGWPFGGPHIPLELAAGKLRISRSASEPVLKEGESIVATFPEQNLVFIASHTGMKVKRASAGAEGYVLDHYNRQALDKHLQAVGTPLLRAFGEHPPYSIFNDSLEVFGSDWTSDLLAEFQKRRGYDLKPKLPALIGELTEEKGAIRNDWALTLTELVEERFLAPAQAWAHAHGTLFRSQTYGTPPVTMASQRFVDLADGEQPHWRQFTASRWASSANHVLGRPVTATETWTWLHSPTFAATPLDVKAEADRHFLQGVNQLIGHGWPYSPESAGKPGWGFYAAAAFNDNNPWWIVMPDLSAYLQRLSWLMREGKPANDLALYIPVSDTRAHFSAGSGRVSIDRQVGEVMGAQVIPQILDAGFGFDGVDDGLLEQALKDGGYKFVVLPNVERIPLTSYRRLERFASNGGLLVAVGRKPSLGPGWLEAESEARQVREITTRLFDAPGAPGHFVADDRKLGTVLVSLTKADVVWAPANAQLGFVHRKSADTDIYFLANTSNQPYTGRVRFRVEGLKPEWLDPLSGKALALGEEITLPPYSSLVALFSKDSKPSVAAATGSGKAVDVSQGWKVSFDGIDRSVSMEHLRSWTEDEATRHFSGTAVYEREVTVAKDTARGRVVLDFGEATPIPESRSANGMRAWIQAPVRDAAIVYVNGHRAGSVWAPPYRVDLTGLLKEGRNELRVVVANTAINRMASQGEPDYKAVAAKYGERFQMQDMRDMKPEPSGLLGHIRLVAE